jgi:hypothetical protein
MCPGKGLYLETEQWEMVKKVFCKSESYAIFKAMKHVQLTHGNISMLLLASTYNMLLLGIDTPFLGCLYHSPLTIPTYLRSQQGSLKHCATPLPQNFKKLNPVHIILRHSL